MTELPNPFNSGAIQASPDEAAVPFRPQVPEGTAADLSIASGGMLAAGATADLARVGTASAKEGSGAEQHPSGCDEISDISQIFVGAAKLEPPEIWFENSAYPPEFDVYYDLLCQIDKPETPDLVSVPDEAAFMIEIGPLPLFMRQAEAAA